METVGGGTTSIKTAISLFTQGEHASVSFKAAETTFIGMNVQADPEVS